MDTGTALLALLRGAHLAALLSLFGTLLFAVIVAPDSFRGAPGEAAAQVRTSLDRLVMLCLALALVLGAAWFAAAALTIATPAGLQSWLAALAAVARGTRFGQVCVFRFVLLLVVLTLRRQAPTAAIVLVALAIALQPVLGHVGALGSDAGTVLAGSEAPRVLAADVVLSGSEALHVLAAGAWLGGLLPLLVCLTRLPPLQAALACQRFAPVRFGAAGVIGITAVIQVSRLAGSLPALLGTAYGRVALLKLGLLVAALGLAQLNRAYFVRALDGDDRAGARRLRLSIGVETAIGLTIVLAAGFLALLTPAVQQQPVWPFPWRLSLDAIDDPATRRQVALALAAAGIGVASAVAGLLWRRARIALLAVGGCLLLAAAPAIRLLLAEAYPTSYYRSPTGFGAESIMHGAEIFAANCAVCHGVSGHGDGPLAGQLPVRPADLTAQHIWGHSDGELFWWVSNGRQATDGTKLMPAFAPLLPDADRWSVIDFVRANNAGNSERSAGAWVVPIAAPALPVVCASLAADDMRALQGSVVRVVADGDEEGAGHPPPIPPQEGYKVLILHLNRTQSAPIPRGECMAATPAAWGAYAMLAGLPPDALPGAEFLVDPGGWLRSAWLPGSGRGWSTPDQLIAQVRLICTHPIATDAGGGHEHHD